MLRRMSSFYQSVSYGPFLACFRVHNVSAAQECYAALHVAENVSLNMGSQELVDCEGGGNLKVSFNTNFSRPSRGEFLLVTSESLEILSGRR